MTTQHDFLSYAEQCITHQKFVCAALSLDSIEWAVKSVSVTTDNGTVSSTQSIQTAAQALRTKLPKSFAEYTALFDRATKLAWGTRERAHAPFSNFLVGATLIADDESLHIGCNVECSSYGLTICAERSAIVSAVAQGKKRFAGIVVVADTNALTPPCGACRQLLYDFAPDAVVVLVNIRGVQKRFTMRELLPEAFSVAYLDGVVSQ
jgi:cytidine deaminase